MNTVFVQATLKNCSAKRVAAGAAFVLTAAAFVAFPSVAQVSETADGAKLVDFCTGVEGAACYTVEIKNASSATVQSTDIDQNSTGGVCTKSSIKVKKNITGNNSMPNNTIGPYIYAKLNEHCAFEVKFNVTSGCVGDTRARIKAGKRPESVMLDKDCGTLKTIKHY